MKILVMEKMKFFLDATEKLLMMICVLGFATMIMLGIMIVLFRFIIESSLSFPDEMIRYLFVWIIALGSAIALRRNIHAAIAILVKALPLYFQKITALLAAVCSMLFFWILVDQGFNNTVLSSDQLSPNLEISMAWVYSAIPIGGFFGLIYSFEILLNLLLASSQPIDPTLAPSKESLSTKEE